MNRRVSVKKILSDLTSEEHSTFNFESKQIIPSDSVKLEAAISSN